MTNSTPGTGPSPSGRVRYASATPSGVGTSTLELCIGAASHARRRWHALAMNVCIAGATGWTGRAVAQGVLDAPDLELASAVSRSAAGRDLGDALGREALGVPVYASAREALDGIDVLVD